MTNKLDFKLNWPVDVWKVMAATLVSVLLLVKPLDSATTIVAVDDYKQYSGKMTDSDVMSYDVPSHIVFYING